jgi:adenine-specific DNA-methyltransferase
VGRAETTQTVKGNGDQLDGEAPAEDLQGTDDEIVQELTDLNATRPDGYEDLFLRRRGQESSHRANRPNQFYAILVDEAKNQVVGIGPPLARDEPYSVIKTGDVLTVYPINRDGEERVWRYRRETMQRYIDEGAIVVGRPHPGDPQPYTLNHRKLRRDFRRLKTVWWEKSHDAGTHGTSLLDRFLGQRRAFPFPKSLYAVRDCLAAVVANRPDALIVDFFAGSGTTLHATCLLNAEDGGRRRSILVTNNEVGEPIAAQLRKAATWPGDPEYEAHGIFQMATRPRCTAAITGTRPDGTPIRGSYRDGRRYADGFEESVEFFDLTYLDANAIDLDGSLDELQPAIWLGARAVGERAVDLAQPWILPEFAEYGVLLKETRFRAFRAALERRPEVSIVYLRTDSPESFAEMADSLPSHVRAQMLPRDYRLFFRSASGNTQ